MKAVRFGIICACCGLMVWLAPTPGARAAIWTVDCATYPAAALGAVLGSSTLPGTAQAGDTVTISGICTEDVTVTQDRLTLSNHLNVAAFDASDGIEGQLEIDGAAQVTVNGLLLGSESGGFAFARGNDRANVYVHGHGSAVIENGQISNGPGDGLVLDSGASVEVLAAAVIGNGTAAAGDGIRVAGRSALVLGRSDGTGGATVAGNAGNGISVFGGGSLTVYAAAIGGNAGSQIELLGGAAATLSTAGCASPCSGPAVDICAGTLSESLCTPAGGGAPAILAWGGSTLQIDAGAGVGGSVAVTGNDGAQALLLGGHSVAILHGAGLSGLGTGAAVLEATSGSAILSADANILCAGHDGPSCGGETGAIAIQVDHVSSMIAMDPSLFGYAPAQAQPDQVTGGGAVNEQSNIDLGQGELFGDGTPSTEWSAGTAGFVVQQNSSFRLSGGAAIAGSVLLQQGSNGFFNTKNGGSNSVTSLTCPSTLVPASHVSGMASVSPAISLAASFVAATTPTCLPF